MRRDILFESPNALNYPHPSIQITFRKRERAPLYKTVAVLIRADSSLTHCTALDHAKKLGHSEGRGGRRG